MVLAFGGARRAAKDDAGADAVDSGCGGDGLAAFGAVRRGASFVPFFLLLLRGAMLQVSAGPYPPTSGCGEVRNSQPEEMFESEPDISQLIVQSESGDRPSGPVDWFWMLVKNHRCILLYCTFFPSREAV